MYEGDFLYNKEKLYNFHQGGRLSMEFDKEHLAYVYNNIKIIKPLNCIFKNKIDARHFRLEQYKIPDSVKKEEEEIIEYCLDILPDNQIQAVYSYENSLRFRYIGLSMKVEGEYKGHIILGPYLSHPLEERDIQKILLEREIDVREKLLLREFYQTVPIVAVLEEITLGKIAYTLLQVGNQHIRYITPDGHTENHRRLQDKDKEIKEADKKEYEVYSYNIKELATARSCLAEREIIYYIYQGDWRRALKSLMEIRGSFVEKSTNNQTTNFKNLILTLNGMIRYALLNHSIDINRLRRVTTKICSEVNKYDKTADLQLTLKEMIVEYCELVNEVKDNQYSHIVLGATRYIRFNFDKEITLKDLANELYVHPNYLSRKFKEETGCQISDYINQVRIEQAQLLLNEPGLNIAEIAYKVGYNDEKYFSKVFKKYNEKTPSEYRNS